MKQLYILLIAILFVFTNTNAQTVVTSDPAAAWGSFMNVFENSNGAKGGYQFGNGWSLENLKTTFVDAGDSTYANGAITLQPNFSAYDAADSYWSDLNGSGNKWMEATTKVEYAPGTFTDTSLSFVGAVSSNDLDSEYTAVAFIKTLDPTNDYAPVINETFALGAAGTTFSISASGINPAHVLQYGFTVEGINANPANETALGSVVVTPNTLVNADPAAAWGSFMNVFENSNGAKGGYQFGNGWSLENLKTTFVDAGDSTYANGAITLQPNFSAYDAADSYWSDLNGSGNKWMEATTKVEYAAGTFTDTSLSFVGAVSSNDLDSEYTAVAFIKTLDPTNDYAPVINETFALGAAGTTFSISASGINPAHVLQYGFTVEGINANPANETALGSVVVTPFTSGFEEPAYTLVTADVSKTWKGYVNWFEKNADGSKGGYVSGDAWTDTNDLKTTFFDTTQGYDNGAIALQPNFNLYEDAAGDTTAEAVWRDGDVGNKHLEASTFVEYAAGEFTDGALKFVGNIDTNNMDNNYEVIAFIKTINATNFSPVITKTVELGAAGTSFEVKATGINSADVVQYGFTVLGLNANPSFEQSLGGVVVTPDSTVLSVTDALAAIGFTVYPNPVENTLNVSAGVTVDKVSIFDLTGREVLRATPNAAAFSLDVSSLNKGLFLVTIKAGEQELNTKLVK